MRIRINRALQSRVARRVALLFFLCAMVPLCGLAIVMSISLTAHLDQRANERLADDVKSVAMDGLGRLDVFESRVRLAGLVLTERTSEERRSQQIAQIFEVVPDVLAYFPRDGSPVVLRGELTLPNPSRPEMRALQQSGRTIADAPSGGERRQFMLVSIGDRSSSGIMAASLDPAAVFNLDEALLPAASSACIVASGRTLACSPDVESDVVSQLESDPAAGLQRVSVAAGPFLVQTRVVPLRATYGVPPWKLVMMRAEPNARESVGSFMWDSWIVVLITGLVVSWISVHQIRQQLRPLDALTAAAQRMGQRNFREIVELRSGDEFEDLGRTFNDLAARLEDQFTELEAFNYGTLAALARAIDAKSPWTGGHSERVTEVAVAIALEMQLPDTEVVELRRGGLVHDIGKLATPPGILDKAGALTPEEFAIMRQHPKKGVHILEPVAAFTALLPIVGQHHERWDGTGYPDRLAGEEISRTARVLAVADVVDALRSDRPYRQGKTMDEVLSIVKNGSGTHFDPAVVKAFERLVYAGKLADMYVLSAAAV